MGEVTKVDTYAPPAPDPNGLAPEAIASMAAQAKNGVFRASANEPDPKANERPAWLPENFKSPEDLVKSFKEAQAELTRVKQGGKPAEKAAEAKPAAEAKKGPLDGLKAQQPEAKAEEQKVAEGVVAKAGLDMAALNAEYAQEGVLSEASMKALEAFGITKDVVDGYIAGQQALGDKVRTELHALTGGAERFDQMHTWSEHNLSEADKTALNKTIDSNNHDAIKLAFAGVKAKWEAAGGNEPTGQIMGSKSTGVSAERYSHRDEMLKDMSSPEYKTNEAFRQKVTDRLRHSRIF